MDLPRFCCICVLDLFVNYTVTELSELAAVPSVGSTDEVACDALELIDLLAAAVRTLLHIMLGILISAVETTVAVVVHRAVSDIILVHKVNNLHDCLRVVSRVTVDLHIEDVATTSECMVRTLDLSLVLRSTLVVHRHVVGVCVIFLICNARDNAEFLLVETCESACEALCRSCKNTVVVLICFSELVHLAPHEGYYADTEFLSLRTFAMVLSGEGDKCLCKSDEADTESSMVDY